MSQPLPRIRMDLDFMPSPDPERPGLFMRDPHQYTDAQLIVPPFLVPALEMFDGVTTDLDLKQWLVQSSGRLDVSDIQTQLTEALSAAGFLENEVFEEMRDQVHQAFAEAPLRIAAHAGGAYPDSADEIREVFGERFQALAPPRDPSPGLIGIAAPHVSPFGGWESYCDAYRALGPDVKDKTFVILGTSHYGEPEKFGLTRKPFLTPFGETAVDLAAIEELAAAAPDATIMEDYCHATEHTIEFQVAFLQYLYGPGIRIAPVLCGPFARSLYEGGLPEDDEGVRRFLDALGELHARRKSEIVWVLGVDMAHMGARYQDRFPAMAHQGEMLSVSARDKDRIASIEKGDARGFWEQVQPRNDDLKWCGASPFYTFLKAVPEARARMLRYQHWQIDPQSVVSFAAMEFTQ